MLLYNGALWWRQRREAALHVLTWNDVHYWEPSLKKSKGKVKGALCMLLFRLYTLWTSVRASTESVSRWAWTQQCLSLGLQGPLLFHGIHSVTYYRPVLLLLSEIPIVVFKIIKIYYTKKKWCTLIFKSNRHQRAYNVTLENQGVSLNRFVHRCVSLGKRFFAASDVYILTPAMPLRITEVWVFHRSEKH